MGRARREVIDGGIYHVMNHGAGRRSVFADDADRVEFGRLLAEIHERHGIEVLAYCLMDNHYHVLVRCPRSELSEAMQHLGGVYTRHVNERAGSDGPIFRARFRSKHVDSDEYVLAATRYIYRNALDVGGIHRVDQYRWSSHSAYLGLRRRPAFLNTESVLSYFDDDPRVFDRFVREEPVVVDAVPTIDSIRAVALTTAVVSESDDGPSARSVERGTLLLLGERSAVDRVRLRDAPGLPSDGALRNGLSQARRRYAESPRVREAVEEAWRVLTPREVA